jgi:hypothetical protein
MYIHHANAYATRVVSRELASRKRRGRDHFPWDVEEAEERVGYGGALLLLADPLHGDANTASGESSAQVVDDVLLGVARLEVHKRGAYGHSRLLEAYDWRRVEPVPFSRVLDRLEPQQARHVVTLLARSVDAPVRLPDVLAAHVHHVLRLVARDAHDLIEVKSVRPERTWGDNLARAELADRIATSLRLAGVRYRDIVPDEPTGPPPPEVAALSSILGHSVSGSVPSASDHRHLGGAAEPTVTRLGRMRERNMAQTDAALFPGWDRSRVIDGWFEFRAGERRVLIKNVDQEPAESHTGGDLIYLRRNPDLAVVVQYKRLTRRQEHAPWLFYDDHRLMGQLANLIALDTEPPQDGTNRNGAADPTGERPETLAIDDPADYRLGPRAGYVKFVDVEPLGGDGLSPLPGCYLPADFAHSVLATTARDSGSLPPFNPRKTRYIDSQTFVTLVAGGWIGTRADVAAILGDKYLPRLRNLVSGSLTMAFDEPLTPAAPTTAAPNTAERKPPPTATAEARSPASLPPQEPGTLF